VHLYNFKPSSAYPHTSIYLYKKLEITINPSIAYKLKIYMPSQILKALYSNQTQSNSRLIPSLQVWW